MGDRQWPHPLDDPAFYEPALARAADSAPSPLRCPDCGETAFPGATICDTCGTPLSVAETALAGLPPREQRQIEAA